MTASELINAGQSWLVAKYPKTASNPSGYFGLPGRERRVLAAAWLADVVKPREKTGSNDGAVVEAILANIGLPRGNPWCAAAQALVADISSTIRPPSRDRPASVVGWRLWAHKWRLRVLVSAARRGDLVTKNYGGGKGHIGVIYRRIGPVVWTIEGNTGAGEVGSQRDGDGLYRRMRLAKFWTDAIIGK